LSFDSIGFKQTGQSFLDGVLDGVLVLDLDLELDPLDGIY
jgi:hypothetical protein